MPRKIIIDTDCCFDDFIAFILALKNKHEINLLGFTIVSGCVLLERGIFSPYIISQLFNYEKPIVYPGNNKALNNQTNPAPNLCGNNGFGYLKVNTPPISYYDDTYLEFIANQIKKYPNELEIVCLGPLTNIAKFIINYPDLIHLIKELHISGTTGTSKEGNETKYAEYNIWTDVEAADIVFKSKINKKVYGWDLSLQNVFSGKMIDAWKESKNKFLKFIYDITKLPREYTFHLVSRDEVNMLDQFLVACLINKNISKFKSANIRIVTEKGEFYGQSILDFDSLIPNCELCIDYDFDSFLKLLEL